MPNCELAQLHIFDVEVEAKAEDSHKIGKLMTHKCVTNLLHMSFGRQWKFLVQTKSALSIFDCEAKCTVFIVCCDELSVT